jgi:hypothetical protein
MSAGRQRLRNKLQNFSSELHRGGKQSHRVVLPAMKAVQRLAVAALGWLD